MVKVILIMHDNNGEYYKMNKTFFENMPKAGQYIYNSDGLAYVVEEVAQFAGYVSSKGAVAILVVHQADEQAPVSNLYGLNIERDLDD
ncbi:LysR family transcriptional regulator [Ligilactobacillus sp. WILCCON 0076]|uniref:LysR family transcriptional regulator n=1 Tax=Ligilactobacillus ubinensis TaxID=2876789 RepID=A0A9X2JKC0_9LACO|nr:LysR family transcriptional regulator [Ligilactobacillus ubinensis]MCP0885974.1 LysR family transcriptional regulator [Ligilactobacillus ubinensis]